MLEQDAVVWCRCEETTDQEIEQIIVEFGARTAEEVKRYTRCGMGPCQGRVCLPHLRERLGALPSDGTMMDATIPRPARPPVSPVTLGSMADLNENASLPTIRAAAALPVPKSVDATTARVSIIVDGESVLVLMDRPLGPALWEVGRTALRSKALGEEPRGMYCARGWCKSCLVMVDGRPNHLACIEPVRPGMRVDTQIGRGRWEVNDDASA